MVPYWPKKCIYAFLRTPTTTLRHMILVLCTTGFVQSTGKLTLNLTLRSPISLVFWARRIPSPISPWSLLSTKPGLSDIRHTPIETFMSSKVVCVAFMVANGHCPCGRAAFFDRNSLLFVHSISFLRPHGALLAQKMHLCILKDPYNNAETHDFGPLHHRLR